MEWGFIMIIELKKLFFSEVSEEMVDFELCFSDVSLNSVNPFQVPVRVKAYFCSAIKEVELTLNIDYILHVPCDRCLEETVISKNVQLNHVLTHTLQGDEDDNVFILIKDYKLNLSELVYADVMLNLPVKLLCREDCRGLCSICGGNMNKSSCDCEAKIVDSRLAVLRQLLEK